MSYIYWCNRCNKPHTSKECTAMSKECFTGTLSIPEYVGGWRIGGLTGLTVKQTRRPRWLTRVLCRWLLEWEWIDT